MNTPERRRSGLAAWSWAAGQQSTVRNRRRRPVLEDLEARRLLSGISVFPVATADRMPTDIAAGPDGNLWFTEAVGDAIGEINPMTHAVTEIPLPNSVGFEGADQVSITAGPDGKIWFADYDGNTIGMIDPTTDAITVFPVPTPDAGLEDITVGPDGNLWFTEKAANQVGMIDPTTDAISEFPVPTANSWLVDIAAGPDGNLWFTEQVGNAIGMIDPTTGAITEYPIPTAVSSPSGIAAGPDGNLWFVESGAIGMIDPTTHAITEFPVPPGPSGTILADGTITAGPDGNLWFGSFNGDEVGSIDPTTDAITVYPVPLDQPGLTGIGGPAAIVAGPDGDMWITLENANEIGVFDPQTMNVEPVVTLPPVIPIDALPPIAPAGPGMPFGFTVAFQETSGPADTGSSGTVTLALVDSPGGATLTVTNPDSVSTFVGLTLKKLGNGAGYKILSHPGKPTTLPEIPSDVSSTRPMRIATEEILTAGKGKNKHVVGFEIQLSKALDPTGQRRAAIAQPVSVFVDYGASADRAGLIGNGTARVARGGRIVVVAGL